jgi:hypothetical protein
LETSVIGGRTDVNRIVHDDILPDAARISRPWQTAFRVHSSARRANCLFDDALPPVRSDAWFWGQTALGGRGRNELKPTDIAILLGAFLSLNARGKDRKAVGADVNLVGVMIER